ncbi:MAG: hypothetical protein DMF59_09530, partial [Acidobacteria bacterium]
KIRRELGESLKSVERFDAPIEQVTTSSLEALHLFSLGNQQFFAGKFREAIPFYQRATDADRNFAMAYARLATAYYNSLENDLAAEASAKAYQLSSHATERERFYIEQNYFQHATGEMEKAAQVLEVWQQTYPRDYSPRNNLAVVQSVLGNYERSLEKAREALSIDPKRPFAYIMSSIALRGLNRGAEAKAILERASANHVDAPHLHQQRFRLAVMDDDLIAMQQQHDWAATNPMGDMVVYYDGDLALSHGQLRKASSEIRKAVDIGLRRDDKEGSALGLSEYYFWSAAMGRCQASMSREILGLASTTESAWRTALGLAFCRESSQALALADELARKHPKDTILERRNPGGAVEILRTPERYDLAFDSNGVPIYLRGLAYLGQQRGREALAEFEKILSHKYLYRGEPEFTLSILGAARASALTGDIERSRRYYADLMQWWQDADSNVPIVQQAKKEFLALR